LWFFVFFAERSGFVVKKNTEAVLAHRHVMPDPGSTFGLAPHWSGMTPLTLRACQRSSIFPEKRSFFVIPNGREGSL